MLGISLHPTIDIILGQQPTREIELGATNSILLGKLQQLIEIELGREQHPAIEITLGNVHPANDITLGMLANTEIVSGIQQLKDIKLGTQQLKDIILGIQHPRRDIALGIVLPTIST